MPGGDRIPLLQYADDTLLFIWATASNAHRVRGVLEAYGAAAVLYFNPVKSTIIFIIDTAPRVNMEVSGGWGSGYSRYLDSKPSCHGSSGMEVSKQ